jgi:hypothetical protein
MRDDESLAIAEPRGRPAQVLKDRFTQEWNIAGAVRVASLNPTNPEASPGVRGDPYIWHFDPPEIVLLTTEPGLGGPGRRP